MKSSFTNSLAKLSGFIFLVFVLSYSVLAPAHAEEFVLNPESMAYSDAIPLTEEELVAAENAVVSSEASEEDLATTGAETNEEGIELGALSTQTIYLTENTYGVLSLAKGQVGDAYFTISKSTTVTLSVNMLSSSYKCAAYIENENGDGFMLGILSGANNGGNYLYGPVMLPAGTYHFAIYGTTSGIFSVKYKDIDGSSRFDDAYYQYEYEDNSSVVNATVLDSRWAFYGSLYDAHASLYGSSYDDMDYYKFSTDGTQRIALTYTATGKDYVVVRDKNDEIVHWGGFADADELLWQTSSSGGKYFYNFGLLPAGDYYVEVLTPDTSSSFHLYCGWLGNASLGFADMSPETPHFRDVDWLAANMISYGWERDDGWNEFRPYANVARQDMAAFLFRLAAQSNSDIYDYSPSAQIKSTFKDITVNTSHCDEVWWLAENKISEGWAESDGTRTFRGLQSVARCDMAAFLYRLAGSPDYTPSDEIWSYFNDVDEETPHYKEVLWLAEQGISKGWTNADGTHSFRPYATVARCDMAAFLRRMSDAGLV